MGLFSRRNGHQLNDQTQQSPTEPRRVTSPNGNLKNMVPLEDRNNNVVVVPQTPIEIPQLLIALGAKPLGTAVLADDNTRHFQLMELPEGVRVSEGRYSRSNEFVDGDTPVHGIRPSVVLAPDNTLLFAVDLTSANSATVGIAWQKTARYLGQVDGMREFPDEIIFAGGKQEDLPYGSLLHRFANDVTQVGLLDIGTLLKKKVSKESGLDSRSPEFEEFFKDLEKTTKDNLAGIDDAREAWIKEVIQAIAAQQNQPVAGDVPTPPLAAPVVEL